MMNRVLTTIAVFIATAALIGCGGPEDVGTDYECGEGTVEEDGECVPAQPDECDDDEVHDDVLGKCVPAAESYCGEDTEFDEESGKCVGSVLECDDNAVEEDSECVAETIKECGEGTVADNGECRLSEEVCGEDTEFDNDHCRPSEDLCGTGTVYDVSSGLCEPAADLSCGPGTFLSGDECVASSKYFGDLADDPDIDLTDEDADTSLAVPDEGDRVVFTGVIEQPQFDEDDEPVQDYDEIQFDADKGEWMEVVVYSMGLPEPGFEIINGDYHRISDRGAGIEVRRELLINEDGTHEVTISNLPQLLGDQSPAGGDDWEYVGFVENIPTPPATDLDLVGETAEGDLRTLSDNYYLVDAEDVESTAMIFDLLPEHTDAEMQVWLDDGTLESVEELEDDAIAFIPPADEFYLVFDHIHASGPSTEYSMSAQEGQAAGQGESITEEVDVDAGDYVGMFQYNLDDQPLQASITDVDGGSVLASGSLEVSTAEEGNLSLYYLSEEDKTVELEVTNDSGEDLDFLSLDSTTGTADEMVVDSDDPVQSSYDSTLNRGHRHFYRMEIDVEDSLSIRIDGTGADAALVLRDGGTVVEEGVNGVLYNGDGGDYVLEVEALETITGGFTLTAEETDVFEETWESSPNSSFATGGSTSDTINVSGCPHIKDIEVTISITHSWIGDLAVDLNAPNGQSITLHANEGGMTSNINATYPYPSDPDLNDGADLEDQIGADGGGDWTLTVTDTMGWEPGGTLNDWEIWMECEG